MPNGFRGAVHVADRLFGRMAITRARSRDEGVVLLHHRVGPPIEGDPYPRLPVPVFEAHLDRLTESFEVLPAVEFMGRLRGGESLKGCATLTFDDGYRDFLEHALPVLSARALPSTHFLVSDCVRTGRAPWNARLGRLPLPTETLHTERDRMAGMSAQKREQALADRIERTGVDPRVPGEMLGIEDLPILLAADVEIGSHTATHAFLPQLAEPELQRELDDSRAALTTWVGRPVDLVSYPQGQVDDRVIRVAHRAGYRTGFAVEQRAARADADPLRIPRFDVTDRPAAMLRLELSGVIPGLRRMLG